MESDDLLALAIMLSRLEAKAVGSRVAEPIHYLLATLKIVDPAFPAQIEALKIDFEKWKEMCKEAGRVRRYLDVQVDKVEEIRHRIRRRLVRNATTISITKAAKIHRSRKTLAAFFDAQLQNDTGTLKLYDVIRSMFELDFLKVEDIRWRGKTEIR